jgi:hypothetical protein
MSVFWVVAMITLTTEVLNTYETSYMKRHLQADVSLVTQQYNHDVFNLLGF